MAVICPTITAFDPHGYREQMERVTPFAKRIHIDLMDGTFAPSKSPPLEQVWWPDDVTADIHLMYQKPMEQMEQLVHMKPHMVIIHSEAEVDHSIFVAEARKAGILVGLAILQDTPVEDLGSLIRIYDHVLIFSGHLGYHGGKTDLKLLDKVNQIKPLHPAVELSWDGGINDQNAKQLVTGGISVLNVGGFIQKSDDPRAAYGKLKEIIGSI